MRTSCIINNYNYGRFVGEAIESCLSQSLPFDEIIVVDDVSTDDSRQILEDKYASHPTVRLIFREANGGQLACLQSGILAAAGDVICMLDADDQLEPTYLQSVLAVYHERPKVDCVFVACELLRKEIEGVISPVSQQLGSSVVLTWLGQAWIGAPTSCLSFRKSCLEQILPYPHLQDWRFRADDYLNFASSMAGARKYYLAENLVNYRWHGGNGSKTGGDKQALYERRIAINRLHTHFSNRLELDSEKLVELTHREYETWEQPNRRLAKYYRRIAFAHRRKLKRSCSQWMSIMGRYLKYRFHQILRSKKQEESISLSYAGRLDAHMARANATQVEVEEPRRKAG